MNKTFRIQVWLPFSIYEVFIERAKNRNKSKSSFAKMIIEDYLQETAEDRIEIKIDELDKKITRVVEALIKGD